MRLGTTRLMCVGLAAASLVVGSTTVPAGAATPTVCTKATFNAINTVTSTAKSTLGGCNNPAATGGSGVLVANFKVLAKITGKITWKGTGTSSFTLKEGTGPKVNKCNGSGTTKDSLIVTTGTITAGTGAAVTLKGTKFSESLCVHTGGTKAKPVLTEYLLPGSKITI